MLMVGVSPYRRAIESGRRGAGRPAVAHLPPSMCCAPRHPTSSDGGDGGDDVSPIDNDDGALEKSVLTALGRANGPDALAERLVSALLRIDSKRKDSAYRSGRSPHWLKMKNSDAPAVKREAEEDSRGKAWRDGHANPATRVVRSGGTQQITHELIAVSSPYPRAGSRAAEQRDERAASQLIELHSTPVQPGRLCRISNRQATVSGHRSDFATASPR